jgi:hypothetical protein
VHGEDNQHIRTDGGGYVNDYEPGADKRRMMAMKIRMTTNDSRFLIIKKIDFPNFIKSEILLIFRMIPAHFI